MKSVPLILCFLLLIGAFICESNANNDNNDINDNIEEQRTVETKSGKIRGIKSLSSLNDIPYYSFKGMPWKITHNKILKKFSKKIRIKEFQIFPP